jgi:hypothetical protein
VDGPRGRQPGRNRNFNGGNRQDEGRRDGYGNDRSQPQRFQRREQRPANPQTLHRRTVHYQVVTMDDEEWGDALEQRLNTLGHDGWRLVAIDEGRQYVFVQSE